jgi:molybdate transport system substrate-binding protein
MKKILAIASIVISLLIATPAIAASNVTVFAASSMTESFTQIGKQFEKAHSGIKIVFSFQASSTLLTQIKAGAPADIFVSAEPFAGGNDYLINRVVLGVPKTSAITKLTDLNNNKITWIQCAHEVPCGSTADAALIGEGVNSKPISLEPKVTSAVAKLLAGEVDAAIIYRTDVLANKKLRAIEFANRDAAKTTYQIAQLRKNRWAGTFINYLQSKAALKQLQSKGFEVK